MLSDNHIKITITFLSGFLIKFTEQLGLSCAKLRIVELIIEDRTIGVE